MSVEGQKTGGLELKADSPLSAHPREGGDRVKLHGLKTPAFAGVSGVRIVRE
jgi:hypothetical protein